MNRPFFSPQRELKALDFVRTIKALAAERGRNHAAAEVAKRVWGEDSGPARFLKTSQSAGTLTPSGVWGSELGAWNGVTAEFFGLVYDASILGRFGNTIRKVPLVTRIIGQSGGTTAYWVGEGKPVPVSQAAFSEGHLRALKIAALTVITSELARSSDPSAEQVIKRDLVEAMAEAINISMLDPDNAGIPEVEPASLTNGVTPITAVDPATDLSALIDDFPGKLETAFLIGSPKVLAAMSSGDRPKIGARGGEVAGIPAIATEAAADNLILVDAAGIALAEGDMEVRVSGEATIEMTDTPTVGPVNTVSLFQTDSMGILTTKAINWQKQQPSVSYVAGVGY